MVNFDSISNVKQERVSFKTLDAVDEFTDLIKSKEFKLDEKRFDQRYKPRYEFDVRKDSLNYYATVRSKTDRERVSLNSQYKQPKSLANPALPQFDQTRAF